MAGGEWKSLAGAACIWDEIDAQIYSLFKDHAAKNRNWNTHSSVCTHPPEEGHYRAGEIHSLAEDHLRVTAQKNLPKVFATVALLVQTRKQRQGPDRQKQPQHCLEVEQENDWNSDSISQLGPPHGTLSWKPESLEGWAGPKLHNPSQTCLPGRLKQGCPNTQQ